MAQVTFDDDDILTSYEVNDVMIFLRHQMKEAAKDKEFGYSKQCAAIVASMNKTIKQLDQLTWDAYPMSRKPKSRRPR